MSGQRGPGAADLLRAVGLLVDGPAAWGAPVRSNRGGVYIVELPAAAPVAPIDFEAIGRWLARVPTLTLDGARPTGRELAARLHRFWLPDQPVLYIGMSGASVGARVRAYYRTPLGDRRPHAGGHWLKTLSGLDRLRVWWAETDAVEEYEDALMDALAAAVPTEVAAGLHDPSVVLPFANLETASSVRKAHGIRGALLADEPGAPAPPARRRTATARTSRKLSLQGSDRVRRPSGAGAAALRAAARDALRPPTRITEAGLGALQEELRGLTDGARPAIVARIKAARELGDLSENAEYQEARREQSFAEGRIQALEELLRHVQVIEEGAVGGRVGLGSTVVVEHDGAEATYTIVGPAESDAAAGRISADSPIGAAFIGRAAGEELDVVTPSGRLRYRIVHVR